MYKKACKEALNFIRPMIIGKKYYGVNDILNDIGTIIVVNQNGDMITTKEIAENIILSVDTKDVFTPIFAEMQNKNSKQIKKIEKKYDLNDKTITNICIQIVDVAESITNIEIVFHKYLNLALIKNTNNNLLISRFPKFENSKIMQGQDFVGIGFAFPEYETFIYNKENNDIDLTYKKMNFPSYPITGIVTRNLIDENGNISEFEISNEIYIGMNGGPVLNKEGKILGMLSSNKNIYINNELIKRVGIVINSTDIINFLKENNVEYGE